MFGGCPARLRRSPIDGSDENELNWSVTLIGPIHSSPVVRADGSIVIGADSGKVFAIDAEDGHLLWSRMLFNLVRSSPAVATDGTIYIGAHTDRLHALRGSDGEELWSFETLLDISSSPVVDGDGTIYVGSENGSLYALNPDGTLKWEHWTLGVVRSSPAIGPDGVIYYGSDNGFLYALLPDGTLKWSRSLGSFVRSSPAVANGVVYVGSHANKLHALRASDGSILWEKGFLLSDVQSSPAVAADGTIYVGADDGKLHAIAANGAERWAFATGAAIHSSPVIDKSGRIYFGSNDDYVYALRPNGTLLWRYRTWGDVRSSPAIGVNGEVIVGSTDTWLYSIGSSDRSTDSDCDGIPDSQETMSGLDPRDPSDAEGDSDNDGIDNQLELTLGGDPLSADTDGDGQPDDPDVLQSTDLDGDGDPLASDNCPVVANPDQKDADRDGVGDECDETATGAGNAPAPVAVGRTTDGRYAAWRLDVLDLARLLRDLHGLRATGTTFRIFSAGFPGSREVVELFQPATGFHVYTATPQEALAFEANGYRRLGVLGYLASSAPALGEPVSVRRFRSAQGREAITAEAAEATALLGSGYQELPALGYGLRDQGELRNPDPVVRFRSTTVQGVVHSAAGPAEDLSDYATEGQQFSVFPGPSGWTVPLYRLRNAAGDEVLATSAGLSGYQNEGAIGYVFPANGSVQSVHPLANLYRLTSPAGTHEHRASLAEARSLMQQGYTSETIARVVALPGSAPGGLCAGEPAVASQIAEAVAALPAEKRPAYVLLRFVQACAILRALDGHAATPMENAVASLLQRHDPYTRAEVRRWADQTLSLSTQQRATLLGELAEFDPGDCSEPADEPRVGQVTQAIVGACSGTSGAPSHISFATLRAPHCVGVTYAADDIGAEDGARAVVAADGTSGCGELCIPGGSFMPDVHGVLAGGHVPVGSPAADFSDPSGAGHTKVGLSMRGVDIGPCGGTQAGSCVADLGQACVSGRCLQFPIVPSGTDAVFSASNVWDVVSAQIEFTEIDPASRKLAEPLPPVDVCVSIPAFQQGEDRSLRCDPYPVAYTAAPTASENRLEQLAAKSRLALAPGKFYRVRAINKNGSFYQKESVPVDPNDFAETGRTVHVCAGPRCRQALVDENAACELPDMPACGSLGGEVWNQPPRSLEQCRAIDPLFSPCEETPFEFAGGEGIIYVDDPSEPRFIQTRLSGIHCQNETGRTNRPNVNPDEVIVAFASVTTDLPDLADLEDQGGFGVLKFDLNAGDKRRPDKVLGSVPIGLTGRAESVLMVGEDDWISVQQWAIAHAAGIVASALGMFGGWQAAVSAGAAAELGTLTGLVLKDAPDPDDPIGRGVWSQSIAELQQRGLRAHDSNIADEIPLLTRIPSFQKHIAREEAGRHPGVDLVAYSSNADLISCSDDSQCTNARVCRLGACVPLDWKDRTLPRGYDPQRDAAGTIERYDMSGSRADYRIYVSTSLSSKDARE